MKPETLNKKFRANGKLYIAGEYTVLDGGLSFALPTKLGQTLEVKYEEESDSPQLIWEAFLEDGSLWFSAEFEMKTLSILKSSDAKLASRLFGILQAIEILNPAFIQNQTRNIHCKTQLEFPKDWGLGSSSTLIYLLAQFSGVDEFELNNLTFKTSGYDVACASRNHPILYQLKDGKRRIESLRFQPEFKDDLYFVYLNKKQDTQISVSQTYASKPKNESLVAEISELVGEIIQAETLEEFEKLMDQHETVLSEHLGLPKVKNLYFSDYEGSVKSLGAWGGDFVMVTGRKGFLDYFSSRGYHIILAYKDLEIC